MKHARIDDRTGEVTHRVVLKKNPLTRRHRVTHERVEKTKLSTSRSRPAARPPG